MTDRPSAENKTFVRTRIIKRPTVNGKVDLCFRVSADDAPHLLQVLRDMLPFARVTVDNLKKIDPPRVPDETLSPGVVLKKLRLEHCMTQAELGGKTGTLRHRISEIERGKRNIGRALAKKLSTVLKVPPKTFFSTQNGYTIKKINNFGLITLIAFKSAYCLSFKF